MMPPAGSTIYWGFPQFGKSQYFSGIIGQGKAAAKSNISGGGGGDPLVHLLIFADFLCVAGAGANEN